MFKACLQSPARLLRERRAWLLLLTIFCVWLGTADTLHAAEAHMTGGGAKIDIKELLRAGGTIGIVIIALSIAMLALAIEHLFSLRHNALMPRGLADEVHTLVQNGQVPQAIDLCREQPSFLSHMLEAGLSEASMGYSAVEKGMEDAATEQAARLYRKIEYFSVIGTIAPMLGLLGTVWGMIMAFMEFELKPNPQVAELAPGIYRALVTTLMGLIVAIPSLALFAHFRNRIDEMVAQTSLMAESVFADFRRTLAARRQAARKARAEQKPASPPGIPPVAIERKRQQ